MSHAILHAALSCALVLSLPIPAAAVEVFDGPVRAEVVRVVDGDTIAVQARPWPGQIIETLVRVRGVDTPELRSSCGAEKEAANAAKAFVLSLLEDVNAVELREISGDKYFGRVVADVVVPERGDLSTLLLAGGYAVPYDGGRKTPFACPSS